MQNCEFFLFSDDDRHWCLKNKVNITHPGCDDYPEVFMKLNCRPAVLFYIGHPIWKTHNLISVVGSRVPQMQSLQWLESALNKEILARHKLCIVSGGARGVDQKAHQIGLRSETPTAVLLPSGLRNIYPKHFEEWVPPIVSKGGCVVSQFLPSQRMEKRNFRERNRLIAALSPFTLLIECRRRSGTMLTAQYAMEFGNELGVMPTFPGESGMGGLDLICDHSALPVRDTTDIELILARCFKSI